MAEARYWQSTAEGVLCTLCPHACRLRADDVGLCGVRRNVHGRLAAEAYGRVSSVAMDPIEKKPLFHVLPGRQILSVGSAGCNFRCSFCQNWTISQQIPALSELPPARLIAQAGERSACGIAYTYNEPLVNFEYVLDCARGAREAGLLNVVVSNGYINPKPLAELLPVVDAWNIDLKSIRDDFYRSFCGGRLAPVLHTIRAAAAAGHVELTHLVVTGGNDREEDVSALVDWVAELSPEIPLHLSRYFPQYRWDAPPTPLPFLERALRTAKRKLAWVYAGNLGAGDDSTYCPSCGELLIPREGYRTGEVRVAQGRCPHCQRGVPGIF